MSASLRPAILDELGLIPAIQSHTQEFEARTGIACVVVIEPALAETAFTDSVSSAVYRIVQELLTNILRHAQASQATIDLTRQEAWLAVVVTDNGRGIAAGRETDRGSLGLSGIEERATLLSGTFSIGPGPVQGTVATLRVPMTLEAPVAGPVPDASTREAP